MRKGNGSIRLSPKHGVNPAVPICFYCNEPKGEVLLLGRLPGDAEAPHRAVFDRVPCDKCAEWMKRGIIFISVRNGESGQNPYRSGGWCVLGDDAVKRVLDPAKAQELIASRVCFLEDQVWTRLGLPPIDEPGKKVPDGPPAP